MIAWHSIITRSGEVVSVSEISSRPDVAVEDMARLAQHLVEAVRLVAEALVVFVRSWWRTLPPYTRAWLRRRHHYAGRPVAGPPRPALFIHSRRT